MEDVLDLYHEPYDERRPAICFDESSKALRGHESDPIPAKPGAVTRVDHRYKRNGKERIHLAMEPLTGWGNVEITERRRITEWIDRMVELSDDHYPDAECIRVVVDQLNTHNPAGFYQFPARSSTRVSGTVRVLLHAHARELAKHGRTHLELTPDAVS